MNKLLRIRLKSFAWEIGTLLVISLGTAILNLVGSEELATLVTKYAGPELSTIIIFVLVGIAKQFANKLALKTNLGSESVKEEVILI